MTRIFIIFTYSLSKKFIVYAKQQGHQILYMVYERVLISRSLEGCLGREDNPQIQLDVTSMVALVSCVKAYLVRPST